MKLQGKTQKGKNRIRENGEDWDLCGITHHVDFSDLKGPWGLMKAQTTGYTKWVHMNDDKDFFIVK